MLAKLASPLPWAIIRLPLSGRSKTKLCQLTRKHYGDRLQHQRVQVASETK